MRTDFKFGPYRQWVLRLGLAMPVVVAWCARADVLISTNGERFVGTIIAETTNAVMFESELGGRLTLSPAQVRKLERTASNETNFSPVTAVSATNAPAPAPSTNLLWLPPGVGHDGADWIQLKSGEWLRGELKYVQDKNVEFDSDELEEQLLKLKDIRQIYTARRLLTQFEGQEAIYGRVVVSNGIVMVYGPDQTTSQPREGLMGITPGGSKELHHWSGKAGVGVTLQSGNDDQTTVNTSAELVRRTPNTTLLLDYLGIHSQIDDRENANNDRGHVTWDLRLNRDWFVRPVQFEAYHDRMINIAYRLTDGVGVGRDILDRNGLEWTVSAGPGFQYTRFDTVEAGQTEDASTAAGGFQSRFEYDLTHRLTFTQTLQCIFTDREAGQYTHHSVSTLEFEIKRHLDLDVSFIWDYLQSPRARSDGSVPERSDYYLTVGFSVRF